MNTRRTVLAGLGAATLGALGTRTAFAAPSAAKPTAAQRIPNVALRTHTGATVRFYDDLVRGKIVVINMMYADCEGLCPPMTNNLVRVQQLLGKRVGKDIFMYSITLRPEQDTPEDLADYAEMHGVEPGWTFLTGAPQDVERLRYALGFYDPDPKVDKQAARHVGMVRIGNDAFDRWSMAPALALPEQIVSSILHVDRKTTAAARAR
jgi:protein SCO1